MLKTRRPRNPPFGVGLALVFAEKRERQHLWQQALKELNVTRSAIAEQWRNEAKDEEREKGLQLQRASLLEVLRARFPDPVPSAIEEAVTKEISLEQLSRWMMVASTATSLEQFQQSILPTNGSTVT